MRWRAIATWLGLISFGLLVGCALVELGVRSLHLIQDRFWELDPVLGVRHIAGKTGWWTQEDHEFRTPIRINSRGLRDVDHDYAKPSGTTRLLLLGDSFVEALQVPLEQMLGRRLEAELGPQTELISAGVSGYGTASELLFLQHEGWQYDPDLVILAFCTTNDVKNNSPKLEDVLIPVYDQVGLLERVREPDSADSSLLHGREGWRDRVQAYRLFRQLLLKHPGLAGPLHRLGVLGTEGLRKPPERNGVPIDYELFRPEPDADWQDAWTHTFRLLSAMRESVTAHGKHFVLVLIPSRYQIYPSWWDETVAAHPSMQGQTWNLEQPAQRLMAWCEVYQADCLNLTHAFRQAAPTSAPLFFHYDGHWTATGHELAARTVAEFLRARHLVSEQSH